MSSTSTPAAIQDEHESDSQWNGVGDPPANELGDFIAANMVAANLVDVQPVAGDYNGDGVVDAADYTVWRDHAGSEVETEIDGDKSGVVDDGDYDVWRAHFGGHKAAEQSPPATLPFLNRRPACLLYLVRCRWVCIDPASVVESLPVSTSPWRAEGKRSRHGGLYSDLRLEFVAIKAGRLSSPNLIRSRSTSNQ